MEVRVVRHPTNDDWERCRYLALSTTGVRSWKQPTDDWKRAILRAGHSPIRTLWFTLELKVPYYVSNHLRTHKVGIEHYVSSQRNDRQSRYDRRKAPQDQPVTHVIEVNASELMALCRARLCHKCDPTTREVMETVRDAVLVTNPEFEGLLAPTCERYGTCDEMRPCGRR